MVMGLATVLETISRLQHLYWKPCGKVANLMECNEALTTIT